MNKNEPGSLMHAYDLAKAMVGTDDSELKSAKKLQGHLGTAAAATGLAAASTKGAAKLLPKITRGGKKGAAYARHLDRSADALLYGGSALGGASGIHQAQIMGAEGRKRAAPQPVGLKKNLILKAYDPEAKRHRREKGYEIGAAAGSAGAVGGAGQNMYVRHKAHAAQNDLSAKADVLRDVGNKHSEKSIKLHQAGDAVGAKKYRAHSQIAFGDASNLRRKMLAVPVPKRTSGKLMAAAAGGAAASAGIHMHRQDKGKTYTGRYS